MHNALFNRFGLEFTEEDKDALMNFISFSFKDAFPIKSYYGNSHFERYFKCKFKDGSMDNGKLQLIFNVNETDQGQSLDTFDIHSTGQEVWKAKIISEIMDEEKDSKTQRQLLVSEINGKETLNVINVVNADILPSYLEGDEIELQMNAIAIDVDYYKDEEDYLKNKTGNIGIANGQIFSTQYLYNHQLDENGNRIERKIDYSTNDHVLLRGTVSTIYDYNIYFDEENKLSRYLCVKVKTQYGMIDLIHSINQIKEDQKDLIKEGSEVFAICVLQRDALIYDYEKGMVIDYKNNLRAIRHAITRGEEERILSIMTDDVVLVSKTKNKRIEGKDNIISYFKEIRERRSNELVSSIKTTSFEDKEIECIYMPYNDGTAQLMCLKLNEDNLVKEIIFYDEGDQINTYEEKRS